MTLKTPIQNLSGDPFQNLSRMIDDQVAWYTDILRNAMYENMTPAKEFGFKEWISDPDIRDYLGEARLEKLERIYADLVALADQLSDIAGKKPLEVAPFNDFTRNHEDLLRELRSVERHVAAGLNDMDVITGLRSKHTMFKDLKAEMSRLDRRGKTFSLALAKIDKFDVINTKREDAQTALAQFADVIKRAIRSFDDAYYINENEFIISLKQSDKLGGIVVLERIRESLGQEEISFKGPNGVFPLTASFCIAELGMNDDSFKLLGYLRKDLEESNKEPGSIIEYAEMSAVERFAKEGSENLS